MSSIDNGVMGLIGGNPQVAKGKAGEANSDGKSLARSSEFSEAYASIAGKSGDQSAYKFKARAADEGGQGEDKDGSDSSSRLQLSRFATGERSSLNGRSIALESKSQPTPEDVEVLPSDTGASEQSGEVLLGDADGIAEHATRNGAVKSSAAAGGIARTDTDPNAEKVSEGDATDEAGSTESADVGVLLSLLAGTGGEQGQTIAAAAHAETGTKRASGVNSNEKRTDGRKDGNGAAAADKASHLAAADTAAGAEMAEADADASDADQLFRLIRADGKGREVELSIGRGGEGAAASDTAKSSRVETVTVLDARRYIGLADVGNSAAVTAAIKQDPEWASSLTAASAKLDGEHAATGKVVNTLKIQMQPIDLGSVTATLRLNGDELVVSLQVETGEAYRQLSDDKDQIVKALRGHGFAVDQVSVQLSPQVDRSANTGQGGAQPQFGGQQQTHEGGNGRQGGGQQGAGDWNGFASGEGLGNEQVSSGNGIAGTQSGRTGGVYL